MLQAFAIYFVSAMNETTLGWNGISSPNFARENATFDECSLPQFLMYCLYRVYLRCHLLYIILYLCKGNSFSQKPIEEDTKWLRVQTSRFKPYFIVIGDDTPWPDKGLTLLVAGSCLPLLVAGGRGWGAVYDPPWFSRSNGPIFKIQMAFDFT